MKWLLYGYDRNGNKVYEKGLTFLFKVLYRPKIIGIEKRDDTLIILTTFSILTPLNKKAMLKIERTLSITFHYYLFEVR